MNGIVMEREELPNQILNRMHYLGGKFIYIETLDIYSYRVPFTSSQKIRRYYSRKLFKYCQKFIKKN